MALELRAELTGHHEDVRGLLCCDLGVLTSSRDKTIKLWVEEGANTFSNITTYVGHTNYVGPLLYIPPGLSADYPNGVIVSGSRDTSLRVWDPVTASCLAELTGHTYQVTGVGLLPGSGEIVSGALDRSLRVWKGGKCVRVLEGHGGPVLCLVVTPTGDILSGSGDMTIKLWQGYTCVHTFTGHTDTVRGLCLLPDIGFVSASHDLTCKVWSMSGEVLAELIGHTQIVYAVRAMGSGIIATGSEDNTCRVWRASGECIQVIDHPGCIWDVAFTADGDLVTACADAVARVWTAREDRKAPAEVTAALADTLEKQRAAKAASAQQGQEGAAAGGGVAGLPPGIKVEDPSALQQQGAKDGATKFIAEGAAVVAYSWDAKEWKWEKIGDVVSAPEGDAAASGGGKFCKGREWDFVFDVAMEDGAPSKKLCMNRGDNPYLVAEQFIEEEGLPAYFKEQVVQFIIQNTGGNPAMGAPADMPITGGFCDPFTGGSASAPQQASRPPPPRPQAQSLANVPITGGFLDPFTGGSSAQPAATSFGAGTQPGSYRPGTLVHTPQKAFLTFDNVPPLDKLAAKIREFNSTLALSPATNSLALSQAEAAGGLDELLAKLSSKASVSTEDLSVLSKVLRWPAAQLFPGLDMARLVALDGAGAEQLSTSSGSLKSASSGLLSTAIHNAVADATATSAHQVGLRLACNAFKHATLRQWVVANREDLLGAFAFAINTTNKAVRLGMATLLGDYAVFYHNNSQALDASEGKMQVASACFEMLTGILEDDVDASFRALVAMATLMHGDKQIVNILKDLGVKDVLRKINESKQASTTEGRKVLEAALDISTLLG